jgi:hypothetical protein
VLAERNGRTGLAVNGVAIDTSAGSPRPVADGVGGAIVTWSEKRGADYDIYAQRISASGVVAWAVDGFLCARPLKTNRTQDRHRRSQRCHYHVA